MQGGFRNPIVHTTNLIGEIESSQIADGAIIEAKLADLSVAAGKLQDQAVENAKLDDGAVTTIKIADASITTAKIGLLAVGSAQIADAAITNAKIDSLSADKITAGIITALKYRTAASGQRLVINGDTAESFITLVESGGDEGEIGLVDVGGSTLVGIKSDNDIGFSANGFPVGQMGAEGFRVGEPGTSNPFILYRGSPSTMPGPGYTFDDNRDTGMYQIGNDTIDFGVGGNKAMGIESNRLVTISASFQVQGEGFKVFQSGVVRSTLIRDTTTGSGANVTIGTTTGDFKRSTSARKYKSRITYNVGYLADMELKPAKFYRKDDKRWWYGFIADDLANQDQLLGTFSDERLEDYDTRELLAIMAAKINRLEASCLT